MADTKKPIKYYWEDFAPGEVRDLGTITPTREEIIASPASLTLSLFTWTTKPPKRRSSAPCRPVAGTPAPWPCD